MSYLSYALMHFGHWTFGILNIKTLKIMLPRGIRNNNPLNIRRSKDQWKGMRAVQRQENGTDSIDDFALLTGWDLCRNDVK